MPKVKFIKPFKFSPDGIQVIEYAAGDTPDVDDLCAEIAFGHGYIEAPKAAAKGAGRGGKAVDAAGDGQADAGTSGKAEGGQAGGSATGEGA